jgi:nitroreductase
MFLQVRNLELEPIQRPERQIMMRNQNMNLCETAVTQTLNQHVSVRSFGDKPVSDEMLHAILNAARRSPTSSNMQTYSILVVRNSETRRRLAVLAGNQCPAAQQA